MEILEAKAAAARILTSTLNIAEDEILSLFSKPNSPAQGDFALPLFKFGKERKVSPKILADEVRESIREEFSKINIKVESLNGYLNFFRERVSTARSVVKGILSKDKPFVPSGLKKEKVIVEYSSPNIAKPFHIGHLRTTLIGHSLVQINEYVGNETIGINHIGDWGTQFGFVYAGCELFGRPQGEATIYDLVGLYIKASDLRKRQDEGGELSEEEKKLPPVNQMARDYFIALEGGDKKAHEFWEWCLSISEDYLNKLYGRLGVRFDYFTGESFYRDKLGSVEKMLAESGCLEESRGAKGIDLGKELGFVRIFTEDGRSLYVTRDLATVDYREKEFSPDRVLYVVGAPQSLYFKQLFEILKRINHPGAGKLVHIAYGNVPGVKTRAGGSDRIWLDKLLDEAEELALSVYEAEVNVGADNLDKEKVAKAVGLGAIFYNYLCRSNVKEFHFKWEDALNFQGATGPYLQYAVARLNSLEEKAANNGITLGKDVEIDKEIEEDEIFLLILLMEQFQESIFKSVTQNEPYFIANAAMELANAFSAVYNRFRVVGEESERAASRLAVFMAVRKTLKTALNLLGIPVVERM